MSFSQKKGKLFYMEKVGRIHSWCLELLACCVTRRGPVRGRWLSEAGRLAFGAKPRVAMAGFLDAESKSLSWQDFSLAESKCAYSTGCDRESPAHFVCEQNQTHAHSTTVTSSH